MEGADRGHVGADERGVVRARRERLVQVHHVGLERADRLDGAARHRAARRRSGATDPLLGTRVLGPTVVMPGSGGGPSHGAMIRASTPWARRARASPSTCACTPPKSDSEYGHDNITRTRPPSMRESSHPDSVVRHLSPRTSRAVGRDSRSLGQFGCRRCQCSGCSRMRSSNRWARSWVTRCDVGADAALSPGVDRIEDARARAGPRGRK